MVISGFVGDGIPEGIKTGVNKDGRIRVLANQLKFYGGVLDKIPYSVTKDGFFKIDLPFISEFKAIRGYIPDYQAVDRNRGIWDVKTDENGYAMFRACQCLIGDVSLNVPDDLVLEATNHAYSGGPHIREVLDDKWVEIVKEKRGKEAAERQMREQAERAQRIREKQAREDAQRIKEEQERCRLIKAREEESQRRLQEQQMQEMLQGSTLFFDTETTGLPPKGMYDASPTKTDIWPRLVQLAWIIADKNDKVVKQKSVIIKPDGFSIPADSVATHGITTERALREGKPLKEVLEEFAFDLSFASQVVGHNIDFDQHIVGAELYRMDMNYTALMNKPSVCTKLVSTNFCALPNPYGHANYKWPSLPELYQILFGRSFDDAHDALADITATKDCYYELKRRGVI
jgi:DNA polymerase III epsilon subunit-like protein